MEVTETPRKGDDDDGGRWLLVGYGDKSEEHSTPGKGSVKPVRAMPKAMGATRDLSDMVLALKILLT